MLRIANQPLKGLLEVKVGTLLARNPTDPEIYIYAHVTPGMFRLISLRDGNRWSDYENLHIVSSKDSAGPWLIDFADQKEWYAVTGTFAIKQADATVTTMRESAAPIPPDSEVALNEHYTAKVHPAGIEVGCQHISFDAFDKLVEAVAKVRQPATPHICDGKECRIAEDLQCTSKKGPWCCTLPKGHPGNHIACGTDRHNLHSWPQ